MRLAILGRAKFNLLKHRLVFHLYYLATCQAATLDHGLMLKRSSHRVQALKQNRNPARGLGKPSIFNRLINRLTNPRRLPDYHK